VTKEASKLDLDLIEKELGSSTSFEKMAQEIEIMTRLDEEKSRTISPKPSPAQPVKYRQMTTKQVATIPQRRMQMHDI
jgi:hypothetical protein